MNVQAFVCSIGSFASLTGENMSMSLLHAVDISTILVGSFFHTSSHSVFNCWSPQSCDWLPTRIKSHLWSHTAMKQKCWALQEIDLQQLPTCNSAPRKPNMGKTAALTTNNAPKTSTCTTAITEHTISSHTIGMTHRMMEKGQEWSDFFMCYANGSALTCPQNSRWWNSNIHENDAPRKLKWRKWPMSNCRHSTMP